MSRAAQVCHRIALYVWHDTFNRTRTKEFPLMDDAVAARELVWNGQRMELKAVLSIDDVMNAQAVDALAGLELLRGI